MSGYFVHRDGRGTDRRRFLWRVVEATNPVNAKTAVWTPSSIPEDWADWRSQWKYSHLLRFVLHLIALSLLVLAILPRRARGPYV